MIKRKFGKFTYQLKPTIPRGYKCYSCGKAGIKLWRAIGELSLGTELYCCRCGERIEKKYQLEGWVSEYKNYNGYQIGNLVPAIPLISGGFSVAFIGWDIIEILGDNSKAGKTWWESLPEDRLTIFERIVKAVKGEF